MTISSSLITSTRLKDSQRPHLLIGLLNTKKVNYEIKRPKNPTQLPVGKKKNLQNLTFLGMEYFTYLVMFELHLNIFQKCKYLEFISFFKLSNFFYCHNIFMFIILKTDLICNIMSVADLKDFSVYREMKHKIFC